NLTLSLQSEQIQLHEKNIELREENLKLKEEISNLKSQLENQTLLAFDGEVYWKDIGGQKEKWPYCPKCYDTRKLSVHLEKDGSGWWCKECCDHFGASNRGGY
ncbi:MAG: hypothetical protein JXR90_06225, partial [Spirochaetes bacterium]|nr:hypothetical protein [Spirochaetota bacterium]